MRLIAALLLVSVLGIAPTVAQAEDTYEPKVIPKCTVYKTTAGEICGFTIDEWKTVLEADAELVHIREQLKNEQARARLLADQIESLTVQAETYAKSQEILVAHEAKLTQDLIDLDKKYQDERVKPRLGSPVAWTISAVAVSVLAGYLLKDQF